MKNFVIVESPAKAKTIEHFLGKDYIVRSCFGHIRDLPKKSLGIDINDNFKPNYEIPLDKKRIVNELKKEAKTASMVWLASDEDREGEAIAWHLSQALSLSSTQSKRIVFHEITEPAIKQAISHPRSIDINLVNAQQARRLLDRLVGYELSPLLWRKIQTGLSAGRVQSVAVRLVVDRERAIKDFKITSNFKINASLVLNNQVFDAELNQRLNGAEEVLGFLEACKLAKLTVIDISQKPSLRNPAAPFTTSTLQQEAARKLGYSVKQTMTIAQRLYETGHITYMRTDSTNLSEIAIKAAANYITETLGHKYLKTRRYHIKSATAQEAHEAIRPTNIQHASIGENATQKKLYQLIWQRMIASQMAAAQTLRNNVTIALSNRPELLIAKGEVLIFDGYLKIYGGGKDDAILPKIQLSDQPIIEKVFAHQTFSHPPARYSEASLVKALEELGIGRPSTYAPTISTIQSRGYVEKSILEGQDRSAAIYSLVEGHINSEEVVEHTGADQNKLLPTHIAEMTTDFLVKYFGSVINTGFTATAEKQLDEIANGKLIWQDSIRLFYDQFHPLVEKAQGVSRQETSQARLLGLDPISKKPIYVRFGRYGLMIQRGEVEDKTEKPSFAPMPSDSTLDSVTLEQALNMFNLPRLVGKTDDGQNINANIGRFGPYIQVDKTFVSIKPLDPFSITESEARDLYNKKLEVIKKRLIKKFKNSKLQVLLGPFGPYVSDGFKNARIPKKIEPSSLSLKQAEALMTKSKVKRKQTSRR